MVSWPGSTSHGLGPWEGSGVYYFYAPKHWASQWHPAIFTSEQGAVYSCAEHWMMHQKVRVTSRTTTAATHHHLHHHHHHHTHHQALLFGDNQIARQIMASTDPREHKRLGRRVRGFDVRVWDAHCRDLVYQGNLLKVLWGTATLKFYLKFY